MERALASERTDGDEGLTGESALVCGATGPVGAAIARSLAARGAAVAVHYRDSRGAAEALRAELGPGRHAAVGGDLADDAATARVFESVAAELGASPTIVVNAAFPRVSPVAVAELTESDLEAHWLGFRMHVNVCRRAIPGMRAAGRGRIVLVSGALAARHFGGFALYGAVKAGLTAFSRTLALEEGGSGITVNVVAPGRVAEEDEADEAVPAHLPAAFARLNEVMRLRMALPHHPTPQDVAEVVAFLASPQAAAVTGQVIYLAAGEPI